jgi:hypothetical protein
MSGPCFDPFRQLSECLGTGAMREFVPDRHDDSDRPLDDLEDRHQCETAIPGEALVVVVGTIGRRGARRERPAFLLGIVDRRFLLAMRPSGSHSSARSPDAPAPAGAGRSKHYITRFTVTEGAKYPSAVTQLNITIRRAGPMIARSFLAPAILADYAFIRIPG